MKAFSSAEKSKLKAELISASIALSNRCLYRAAKWAAEAAEGILVDEGDPGSLPNLSGSYILAKSYFDCNEYDRCSFKLENATDNISVFLRLYSKYISGEKKKEEENEGILTPKDNLSPNMQIVPIIRELDSIEDRVTSDPYLLYLSGVALRQQKNEKEAIYKLVQSIKLFPYNWSAWLELCSCLSSLDALNELSLPDHVMTRIFMVYAQQEFFQMSSEILFELESLKNIFEDFAFLDTQKALLHYHGLKYPEAEEVFEKILKRDPYSLDAMDVYSNVLYVMERAPKISFLAQLASSIDKFRPETCCIIANYYSLKSEHERAITYYQRALILNRNFLSAWTLLGHEFVELKNTHAAIESYRRAVDASKGDFRGWYGLGQTYEMLEMHYYSLYYYQRALAIKPDDPRMWIAVGNCFEKLDRLDDSIKAYKRALKLADMDPEILIKIAYLYEKSGDIESAATFMKLCVSEEANEGVTDQTCSARLWMARREMRLNNWSLAHDYAEGVSAGSVAEIEEARAIVRDAKNRMQPSSASSAVASVGFGSSFQR